MTIQPATTTRPIADTVSALDFAPAILKSQRQPPSPYPRFMLYALLLLLAVMLIWAFVGRLDVVAVAPGKLVPQSFLKVVQPAESGILREILVKEGDVVAAGQVLMRMDASLSEADHRTLINEIQLKRLQVKAIDADLHGGPLTKGRDDPATLFAQVNAQFQARRGTYRGALDTERAAYAKAEQDYKASAEVESKLRQTGPIYREQEAAWEKLTREGFAGRLYLLERQRQRIENEQDLRAQQFNIESAKATMAQSEKRMAQIVSTYRQQLHDERVELEAQLHKLEQDKSKHQYRNSLLELKAPQSGVVKDLATHTQGSVVAPGTVLLTLVPNNEPLLAEIWIDNTDSGFVEVGQKVRVKLSAYPFQKYGMLDGVVRHVTFDAAEKTPDAGATPRNGGSSSAYRALVALGADRLRAQGSDFRLTPGMQVSAEIHLGYRSVIEYLLSPVQKTLFESGRER